MELAEVIGTTLAAGAPQGTRASASQHPAVGLGDQHPLLAAVGLVYPAEIFVGG
jgi:hypothetical protein